MFNIEVVNVCGGGVWLIMFDWVCSLMMEENFDGCQFFLGWNCSSIYVFGVMWQVGDSICYIINFGIGFNLFDGFCMFYFDDDVLGLYVEYIGCIMVISFVFDFVNWEEI